MLLETTVTSPRLDTIEEILVPIQVVGELCYGAYKSSSPEKHTAQIRFFLLNCKVLLSDNHTADIYGNTKAALMRKGRPIPENDIWIASLALQHQIPLFTTDNHFTEIENLETFK